MRIPLTWLTGWVLALALHASPAWAQSKNLAPGFTRLPDNAQVVVMPIDVELFSISVGGVIEPRADWTEQAQKHLQAKLLNPRNKLGRQVRPLGSEWHDPMAELNSLHGVVAQSIFAHHMQSAPKLPTKNGELRWTLGDAVAELRNQTQADYALFVWIRDTYASTERKVAMMALAVLGVSMQGGTQVGYASLVRLKDGQVVWFNDLGRGIGDLREADAAQETVQVLFKSFPRPF